MTVRELLKQLLEESLDDEVKVLTFDKHGNIYRSDVDGILRQDKPGITVIGLD